MNALTPNQQNSNAAKLPTPQISPGLNSLLTLEPNAERAISEIAKTPAMLAEAKAALPTLHAMATMPAGEEGVRRVIGSRRALFPQPERTSAESAAWWADYFDVLADLPEGAIEAAMQAWVKLPDAEFMPKPGKLLELAKTTPNRSVKAYQRCKAAVEYQPPREVERLSKAQIDQMVAPLAAKVPHQPSQADKERVKRMMREFIEADEARKAKLKTEKQSAEPACGVPDETGITPELRQALQNRGYNPFD